MLATLLAVCSKLLPSTINKIHVGSMKTRQSACSIGETTGANQEQQASQISSELYISDIYLLTGTFAVVY
jgi:hypothetical protein